MNIEEEMYRTLLANFAYADEDPAVAELAAAVMPLVKRAQAEARAQELRDFASDLDRYVGTILNAESAARMARVKANGIENGEADRG
ncbi:hypothetical protein ECC01_21370 [Bacillus tequilensis]|nr:hypothetical protein [Bacillus tequilensis]